MARLYNLIFVLRRLTYVMLCFFKNESGGLLLTINIFINFIYGIYMASSQAFRKRCLNRQNMFNEWVVSASIYWKILYTNYVGSQEDQYEFSKIEISLILFYCFVNLVVIIYATIDSNKKYLIYFYKIVALKLFKFLP